MKKEQGSTYSVQLLREEYLLQGKCNVISPVRLAEAVYTMLDPHDLAPPDVAALAILELRQLARQICAERYKEQEEQIEQEGIYAQQEMFEGLQHRYPARRDGDDSYVLLDDLTEPEGRNNSARLMHEGQAKIGHARALNAFLDKKFSGLRIITGTNS